MMDRAWNCTDNVCLSLSLSHTHTHTHSQICLVFISVCSLKLTACLPPPAFSCSSLFDASLETQDLLMETRKRLLTTLPSCHSCQFITVMFQKEGGKEGKKQNRFAVSVISLHLQKKKNVLAELCDKCCKMTDDRNKFYWCLKICQRRNWGMVHFLCLHVKRKWLLLVHLLRKNVPFFSLHSLLILLFSLSLLYFSFLSLLYRRRTIIILRKCTGNSKLFFLLHKMCSSGTNSSPSSYKVALSHLVLDTALQLY